MKIDSTDIFKKTAFYKIGPQTAIIWGTLEPHDLRKLKNWVLTIKIDGVQDAVLLLDSDGGASDPSIIAEMLQVPIHTHVLTKACSFAAMLALAGSYKTATIDSALMFHRSRWDETKESENVGLDAQLLFTHQYKMISMTSSILPAGPVKELVCDAMLGEEDVYIFSTSLFEDRVFDELTSYEGGELELYEGCRAWYDRTYNKEGI